jgi:uncharacterized membrane protein YhaH (DUF805 family)
VSASNPIAIYLSVLKRYADFSGRARRREYWWFTIISTAIVLTVFFICYSSVMAMGWSERPAMHFGRFVASLYVLATLFPSLGVSVRRLHDIGATGWLVLLGFVPLAGLVLFFLYLADSQIGPNKYGPSPKEMSA